VHIVQRAPAVAPAVVVQRPAARAPAAKAPVKRARVAPRPAHRARPRHVVAAPLLRIPDHAPPTAIGALDAVPSRRRIPLVLVAALGALTLASGALVGTVARAARG
jgi:hypothetical protein